MGGEVNVVALVRGEEQYIFVFDEKRRTELLRLLGRYAADPSLLANTIRDSNMELQDLGSSSLKNCRSPDSGNPACQDTTSSRRLPALYW